MRITVRLFIGLALVLTCTKSFAQFIPSDLAGLKLWLRADTLVSGNVSLWQDFSTSSNNASQASPANQPVVISNIAVLNNLAVLNFNGSSFLDLTANPILNDLQYTMFILERYTSSAGYLYDFDFGGQHAVYKNIDSVYDWNGTPQRAYYYDNNQYHIIEKEYDASLSPGYTSLLWNNGNGITDSTWDGVTGATNASGIKIGGYSGGGFQFAGDIAEIIIYNSYLTEPQRLQVEGYLRNKYSPPFRFNQDTITTHSICDTILDAGPLYTSYSWNGSATDTTRYFTVSSPGRYYVTVTDIFGFVSSDTITIYHPYTELSSPQTLCLGDSLLWNTNLTSGPYSFSWSTGDTTPSIYINSPGQYWVRVDTVGCSSMSDTVTVVVDSFSSTVSLGPDANRCTGNTIALVSGAAQVQTYLWSDSTTGASLTLQNSGTYWVSVTDSNGCVARDSIGITIVGVAPLVNFSADTVCKGDTTFFTDLTPASDTIVAWNWNFGEPSSGPNNISTQQNPYHIYANSGMYMVILSDTTTGGCYNDTTITVRVHPNPVPLFSHTVPCTGTPVQFTNSTDTVGIFSWLWNFGDPASGPNNVSALKNPSHIYNAPGSYNVTLTVTLNTGCIAVDTVVVVVGQTVIPNFSFFNTCIGQVTNFFTGASGASLLWNFGDNSFSTQQNPLHQYAFVGTYPCTLTAITMAGCTSIVANSVVINDVPVAYFRTSSACVNVPYQLLDSSYISAGSVTLWQWSFPDFSTSTQQNPYYTFSDTLQYNITLVATSNAGCKDTITRAVKVHPLPTASFTSDISYGDAPLNVDFTNLSSGAVSYMWDFGDTSGTSVLANPSYTFTSRGTYPVTLIANTLYGCSDTSVKYIFVVEPTLDLAVTSVTKTSGANSISISAGVANLGNIAVSNFKISAWLENSLPVFENWNGNFPPQSVLVPPYTFAANFEIPEINPPNYLCVEITEVNNQQDDNPANNIRCINLGEDFVVVDPYPNPAAQVINLQVVASRKDFLEITIYDASGKLIKELFNGVAAAGLNKFSFDTSSLASGTYFCRYNFSAKTIVKPLSHISKKK